MQLYSGAEVKWVLGNQSAMPSTPMAISLQVDTAFSLLCPTCTSPKDTCSLEEHILARYTELFFKQTYMTLSWVDCKEICWICQSQSLNLPLPIPSPPVTISLFSTSVTLFCKEVHLHHYFLDSAYVISYLSFSDLLNSVWQSLGPSMLLQMTHYYI